MSVRLLKKGVLDKDLYVRNMGYWILGCVLIISALLIAILGMGETHPVSTAFYGSAIFSLIIGIILLFSATAGRMEDFYKTDKGICLLTKNSFCRSNCTRCVFAETYLRQEYSSADAEEIADVVEDLADTMSEEKES